MLSITPISVGAAGVNYLLNQAGCREAERVEPSGERDNDSNEPDPQRSPAGADRYGADYLIESREPDTAARWWGSGVGDVGVDTTQPVRDDDVRVIFGRLEHPGTGEPLGSRPRRFTSVGERLERALAAEPEATPERKAEITWKVRSNQRRAVGYYDLTFSPAKSVSVLWAAFTVAGRDEQATQVWSAHRAGVAAALAYLEQEAGYSRAGYHGRAKDGRSVGEYVAGRSWTAVEFDHTLSRAEDPQLHTHVALLNRARSEHDREWRALDSRGLFHARVAAGALYERTYEEALQKSLGVEFAARPDGRAREIVSIPPQVRAAFSQRRSDVVAAVDEFIADYTDRHGHPPAPYDIAVAAQHAARTTRLPKQSTPIDQLEQNWSGRLDGILDSVDAAQRPTGDALEASPWERGEVIAAAVREVQSARSTWTHFDLLAALDHQLPPRLGLDALEHRALLESLAREAESLDASVVVLTPGELVPTPDALRRESDGRPRFRPHRDERYATLAQLDAEERLLALTRTDGAPALGNDTMRDIATELTDLGLGEAQRDAVVGILGSSRRADVLIGPAGTGKSFTLAALSRMWQQHHGAPALGVATSQAAAQVLDDDGIAAVNVAQFLQRHEPSAGGSPALEPLPDGTLVVVDEAGMSATDQLDRVRAVVLAAGGKVVFTGDDRQLGPVGAGGVLAHLARLHPESEEAVESEAAATVFRLTDPRRFREAWEGPASLRLRAGAGDAVRSYDDHGRIRAGHEDEIAVRAIEAYVADSLGGRQSLLIVPTNQQATELAGRIRTELLRLGRVEPDADAAVLRDGNRASRGDLIQTRRNNWSPTHLDGPPRAVVNRQVWAVDHRDPDGGLQVRSLDGPPARVRLEPEYVAAHVTLAYAGTVHAAQGRTVDTAHTLIDPGSTRDALYVAMTRGREANTAWVTTAAEVDDERTLEPLRADYIALLTDIVERAGDDRTATEVLRDEAEHNDSLLALGTVWSAVSSEYRRDVNTDRLLARLGPERTDALVAETGYRRLLRAMHELELEGHDLEVLVDDAVGRSELSSANSVADVLRWRMREAVMGDDGAQRDVSSWRERSPHGDDELARYLSDVGEHMDRRQHALGERAAQQVPGWAWRHLGPPPEEAVERADWVERAGMVAAYRELYAPRHDELGPAPSRENPEARAAWIRAYRALGAPDELREYRAAHDDDLRALIAAYEREEKWAPPHVADDLRDTRQRAADYLARFELAAAKADVAPTAEARDEMVQRATAHREFALWQEERAQQLELVHDARAGWFDETTEARDKADHARRELAERDTPEDLVEQEEPAVRWSEMTSSSSGEVRLGRLRGGYSRGRRAAS